MRVIHLTESRWPNHDNDEPYFLNLTEIETNKPYETNKPWLYIRGPSNLCAWCFFLLRSEVTGLVRLGRCPSQCKLASQGWGDWPSWPHQHIFLEKLMFVSVMNFGQIKKNKVRRREHFSRHIPTNTNFWSSWFGQVN